ncbi:MAG: metallophosphoesterase family protein [Bacteroidota bacterium]
MKRLGLLSDTHGFLDARLLEHFEECDEIWHAGDFGSIEVSNELERFKPLRGVYGNIDGAELRKIHPLHQRFRMEGFNVWMTHIGGYPPAYNPEMRPLLRNDPPDIFICGHSHILRILRDDKLRNMLYINPGAAGREGFHKVKTAIRFTLDDGKIKDMEVIELGNRGELLP